LKSESRHFQDYLELARSYSDGDISARVKLFATTEAELISSKDTQFRFHSGLPA
jgi:tRNA-(ms[2]io[6]A)-hydroxylase